MRHPDSILLQGEPFSAALSRHLAGLLPGNRIDEQRVAQKGADLRQVDLRGSTLAWINLSETDLREAALSDCDLRNANLAGADLRDADLSRALLGGTRLAGADLRGARLVEADLTPAGRAADLRGARFGGSDVCGATGNSQLEFKVELQELGSVSASYSRQLLAGATALIFCALTIVTTGDDKLIPNSMSSELPLIRTSVPIVQFFYFAPLVLVLLSVYGLLLMWRLHRLLDSLPAVLPDGTQPVKLLPHWLLQYAYIRPNAGPPPGWLAGRLAAVAGLTWMTPVVVALFWIRAVGVHDPVLANYELTVFWLAGAASAVALLDMLFRWRQAARRPAARLKTIGAVLTLFGAILVASMFWLGEAAAAGRFASRQGSGSAQAAAGEPADDSAREERSPAGGNWWLTQLHCNLENRDVARRVSESSPVLRSLARLDLRSKNLIGASANNSCFLNADLSGGRLDLATFRDADMRGSTFRNATLRAADFTRTDLRWASFEDASFPEPGDLRDAVIFRGADLSHATFSDEAPLQNVVFREAILHRTRLSNADLTGTNLIGADLKEGNLHAAILKRAWLRKAKFHRANLSGADLSCADAVAVEFQEANVENANFCGVNLYQADLTTTDLTRVENLTLAQVKRAKHDPNKLPDFEDQEYKEQYERECLPRIASASACKPEAP